MQTPEELLRGWGLSDHPVELDWGIHSWRCSYPDRYGACSCFQEIAQELAARDAAVAAKAWGEGCAAGLREANDKARGVQNNPARNPYREAGESDADA